MLTLVLVGLLRAGLFLPAGRAWPGLVSAHRWLNPRRLRVAAKKAFVMNRVGDMGMLIAMMGMAASFQSVSFSEVSARSRRPATFIGFLLVAALRPRIGWATPWPASGPPVSALIHAGHDGHRRRSPDRPLRRGLRRRPHRRYRCRHHRRDHASVPGAIVGCAKDDMKKIRCLPL